MRPLLLLLLAVSSVAIASDAQVRFGAKLGEWPASESSRVVNELGAYLIVTPDRDWQQKWETPPETVPYLNEAKRLRIGEQVSILTFLANPKLDDQLHAKVLCDLKATRPDGSIAFDLKDVSCLEGKLLGPATNVRISSAVVDFVGEVDDPKGMWTVDVRVRDMNGGVTIDLKAEFELIGVN